MRRRQRRRGVAVHSIGQGRRPLRAAHLDAGDERFELTDGGTALFALVFCVDGPLPAPDRDSVERRVRTTAEWWQRWVERHEYDGPWADEVLRSALALKLLTHSPTGAMAAAATTSLPEKIGGDRNWDYRFAWVRDSSFAIDALLRIGRLELVHSALRWLLDAVERTHPRLNVLYDLDGGVPDQCERAPPPGLPWLASRPQGQHGLAAASARLATATCSRRSRCTSRTATTSAPTSRAGSPRWRASPAASG